MAKKPDIGPKEFSKLIEDLSIFPHKALIKKLDSKMFTLDTNQVINYKPEYLAAEEYKRCLAMFRKRNQGQVSERVVFTRYDGAIKLVKNEEAKHRKALEQLAISTIKDLYQVPDYIDLQAIIRPGLGADTHQDNNPSPFLQLSLQEKNEMRDEIQKRVILNSLVHGASINIWKTIHHLVDSELDAINGNLRHLYDQYTATFSLLYWFFDPDNLEKDIEQDRQMNKGVLDWIISAGIPQNYNQAQLEYYYSKADRYQDEIWHYLLGATLWHDLLQTANLDNSLIPKLLRKVTEMDYQELTSFFRNIIDKNPEAKNLIDSWNIQ